MITPDEKGGSSDAQLVEECRRGDAQAWAELIDRYGPMVYGIARRFRLASEDCVDVFGQVCKVLLENLDKLRSSDRLPGYVSTTAQRACLAVIRERERWLQLGRSIERNDPDAGHLNVDADEIARAALRGHAVRRALALQEDRCRKLLWLLFFDEHQPDYHEIARQLRMPVPSVGPTRSRCLEKFRRTLETLGLRR